VNQDQEGIVAAEDRLAGDLLDRLNQIVVPEVASLDDGSEALSRGYLELVGLLPYELDPVEPSPAVKARLMRSLKGADESQDLEGREEVAVSSAKTEVRSWRSWGLPLAAGLALALVGLSGWQRIRLERQQDEIVQLSGRLREVNLQSAELARYREQLDEAQAKLSVLASSGVEVCSLHPMEERLTASAPTATLFVAPDHQHWYLRIDGLEPSPKDRAYQLWFITEEGAKVSAGTFDPRPGVRTELTSETMPGGTVAVSVTIEPLGGSPEPSGPPLLYGDEVMRIL
jgi:anti-sigma-K factor RskA